MERSPLRPAFRRAILLVDHGSTHRAANEMLADIARLVALEAPDAHVEFAHMELEAPSIDQGVEACVAAGATEIVVCPYLLAPGRHSTSDIPRLATAAAARHAGVRVIVSEPLGIDARLAAVVARRVDEACEAAREHPRMEDT